MIGLCAMSVTVGFTILSAVVDSEHLNENEFIDDHTSRWLLRFSFFASMLLIDLNYFIASSFLFIALFDQLLNLSTGKPFLYLGSVAKWDRFFKKRKVLYVLLKLSCLAISIYLFLK